MEAVAVAGCTPAPRRPQGGTVITPPPPAAGADTIIATAAHAGPKATGRPRWPVGGPFGRGAPWSARNEVGARVPGRERPPDRRRERRGRDARSTYVLHESRHLVE